MSLNNIELGDLIVSELYRDSLLATEAAPPPTAARPSVPKAPAPSIPGPVAPVRLSPGSETNTPVNPVARTSAPPIAPASPVPTPSAPETKSAAPAPSAAAPSSPPPPDGSYKFLGNNRRKIPVLV